MKSQNEIIDRILAAYAIAGRGKLYDIDVLEIVFEGLMADFKITPKLKKRLWGIIKDVFNKERNGELFSGDVLEYLKNELNEFMSLT